MPINEPLTLEELRNKVRAEPGSSHFVELAKRLGASEATRAEAREVCLRGLSEAPSNLQGRLQLARLFYLDSMTPFCLRELRELRALTKTPALDRLLEALGDIPGSDNVADRSGLTGQSGSDMVVAEVDLDAEFLDVLEEIDKADDN